MFAIIKTGGKQYRVAKDDVLLVEKLDAEPGDSIALEEVLVVGHESRTSVGAPRVSGAVVTATVVDQTRGDKIIVFKKKRRQNYRRKKGHRQDLTLLRITGIRAEGFEAAAEAAAPTEPAPNEPAPNESAQGEPVTAGAEETAADAKE